MIIRAVVDYQVFGEGPGGAPLDPKQWLDATMQPGVEHGQIVGYSGEYFGSGPFGLYYVLFTVDVLLDDAEMIENAVTQIAADQIKIVLEMLLGEDDFSIRFLSVA